MAGNYWVTVLPDGSKLEDGIKDAVKKAGNTTKVQVDADTSKVEEGVKRSVEKVSKSGDAKVKVDVDVDTTKSESKIRDLSGKLRKSVDDATKDAGSVFDRLSDGLGHAGGKIGDAIRGGLKDFGIDTGPLTTEIDHVGDKVKDAQGWVKDISGLFDAMPGKVGSVASALADWGGPIAIAIAGLKEAEPIITRIDDAIRNSSRLGSDLEKFDPAGWGDWLGEHLGAKQSRKFFGNLFGYDPGDHDDAPAPSPSKVPSDMLLGPAGGGDQASSSFKPGGDPARWGDTLNPSQDAYDFFSSGQALPSSGDGFNWGGDRKPETPAREPAAPRGSAVREPAAPRINTGSVGGVSSRGDARREGGRIAALYDLANSLVGTPYSQALRDDCSGMVSRLATAALGMDPSVQFSTVNEGDWLMSHGFQEGMGPAGSFRVGWYDHGGGNAGHTAATLPGGEHAESGGAHGSFLVGAGAAGADDPQFEHHAWLPMDGRIPKFSNAGSSGKGGSSSAAGGSFASGGPSGSAADPIYVISAGGIGGGPGGVGGIGGAGGGFGGGGDLSQLGGIAAGGMTESLLPQGFSDPTQWPTVKSGMAALNFFAGLGGGIPDPTGGLLSGAASSFGLNVFNPQSGSPKLAPGEFNPANIGASATPNIAGALSAVMPKGGDGATVDQSLNVQFDNTAGQMPTQWKNQLDSAQSHRTRTTTGPGVP